jgi:hypothetical protein
MYGWLAGHGQPSMATLSPFHYCTCSNGALGGQRDNQYILCSHSTICPTKVSTVVLEENEPVSLVQTRSGTAVMLHMSITLMLQLLALHNRHETLSDSEDNYTLSFLLPKFSLRSLLHVLSLKRLERLEPLGRSMETSCTPL